MMPLVSVRLFATLQRYLPPPKPGEATEYDIPEGTTVAALIDRIGVPADQVKIVMINGIHARQEQVLREGDRVGIFPPIAGG